MSEPALVGGQLRYILVLDGDVNERLSLSMLLQQFGYTVVSARNPAEAIEFLCVAPAAAVFSEAGESGTDMLSRLEADARFRDVPLVVVSEEPSRSLSELLRNGKLAGLLRKPLDPNDVFQVIQQVIEKGTRKSIRIATALPAVLHRGDESEEGYVTVLSQYGMFFRTLEPRPVHERVVIDVEIWDSTIRVEAVVLYVVTFEEGPFSEPGMGMKFVKIGPEESATIRYFISEQIGLGFGHPGAGQS
ncbi:MAG: PilZ domain-containing protein [Nitrospiraceae bacterium]|nr:PilZ domain-containing protein [Nitrospiraceae bacterium]